MGLKPVTSAWIVVLVTGLACAGPQATGQAITPAPIATPVATTDLQKTIEAAVEVTAEADPDLTAFPEPTVFPAATPEPTIDVGATITSAVQSTLAAVPTPTLWPTPLSTPSIEPVVFKTDSVLGENIDILVDWYGQLYLRETIPVSGTSEGLTFTSYANDGLLFAAFEGVVYRVEFGKGFHGIVFGIRLGGSATKMYTSFGSPLKTSYEEIFRNQAFPPQSVRQDPSVDSPVVADIPGGQTGRFLKEWTEDRRWVKISLKASDLNANEAVEGWIPTDSGTIELFQKVTVTAEFGIGGAEVTVIHRGGTVRKILVENDQFSPPTLFFGIFPPKYPTIEEGP